MPTPSASIVLDTGVLYASADRGEPHHAACRRLLQRHGHGAHVPTLIVGEVAYLLARRIGAHAEATFLANLVGGGLIVEHPSQVDLLRMAELVWTYRDLPLGAADASVVALAERLGVTTIGTLDRRDFTVVKPRHADAFEIVP